jgi:hypothetical protein
MIGKTCFGIVGESKVFLDIVGEEDNFKIIKYAMTIFPTINTIGTLGQNMLNIFLSYREIMLRIQRAQSCYQTLKYTT